jgi:hypothetical protein
VPPSNHPSHPSASGNGRRMSAYSANSAAHGGSGVQIVGTPGRVTRRGTGGSVERRGTVSGVQGQGERERDCVVM